MREAIGMNNSISARGRFLGLDVLARDRARTDGNNWGRVLLGAAIVGVTLGVIYLPYFLELLWS